jgi:hypothetical protein
MTILANFISKSLKVLKSMRAIFQEMTMDSIKMFLQFALAFK